MAKPKTPAKKEKVDTTPPDLFFHFPDETGRKPIKMTYGLEMDIRRMLPDPRSTMELLLADPVTQDYILRRCLTEVNKMVTDFDDLVDEDSLEDLDIDTRDRVIMWAGEHAMYFFAKRTMGMASLGVRLEELLPALLPERLQSGLKDYLSQTPSAGPSEPPKPE